MQPGEWRSVDTGDCRDLYLIETGMYDVTGYGGVYVLDAARPAIIETGIGTGNSLLQEAITDIGIDPDEVAVIAVTHVHLDHAGGAGMLAAAYPNAKIVVHERGARHLVDPERLIAGTKAAVGEQWDYYTKPVSVPEDRIRSVRDGTTIELGDHELHAIHTPGHASHQVVYYDPTIEAVFTGDAAGLWIPERGIAHPTTPPPEFDLEQAIEDLGRIAACEPTTLAYTHFGPAPYADELLTQYEEALREWVERVAAVQSEQSDAATIATLVNETDLTAVWGSEKGAAEAAVNARGVLRYLDRSRAPEDS